MEEQKSNKKLTISLSVLLFFAVGSTAGLGYLYLDAKQDSQNAATLSNQKIKNIQREMKSLPSVKDTPITKTPKVEETTYTGKIGKFSLKLPSEYTIIQIVDGGGEGGPATVVQLARKVNGNNNIVSPSPIVPLEISSRERGVNETAEQLIQESGLGTDSGEGSATPQPDLMIAGEKAKVIQIPGLVTKNYAAFVHNNNIYTLTYDAESGKQELADMIKGFTFTD